MNDEDQLRSALGQMAGEEEVDVAQLYAATLQRLDQHDDRLRGRRHHAARTLIVAAAAVVGVAALVVATPRVSDRLFADDSDSSSGQVADAFTCPVQRTTDFTSGAVDDSFLPELSTEARPRGEAAGAPRYAVTVDGEQAKLRLGNADGTLASVTTFEKQDARYERIEVIACSNEPTPGAAQAPLVVEGLATTSSTLRAQDVDPDAVAVADRLVYDVRGLSKRVTAFAYPCDRRVCVESGSRGGTVSISSLRPDATPFDLTGQLADPDDVVGVEPAQLLLAVYDGSSAVAGVSWTDRSGERTVVDPVDPATWEGRLYLVLVPSADLGGLEVRYANGERATYTPEELRD